MSQVEPLTVPSKVKSARSSQRLWFACVGVALTMIIILRLMGRLWWCKCGTITPFCFDAWGPHNSQHLLDPYSFSHLLHGVIFFFVFNFGRMRRQAMLGLLCAMVLESGWEIFENTPFTIDRYRAGTAAVGYTGDTIVNSAGDLLSCVAGWWIARKIGMIWSVALFIAVEVGCLIWIKDNLTFNVIMIIHPIDAIKRWQAGG